jgi:hypothetical protein
MPTTAPDWWYALSGWCFGLSILANVVLVVVLVVLALKVLPLIRDLQVQVRRIGEKATDIATTAQSTMNVVHDRTTQILGSAETASAEVVRRVSVASAGITALFVAARILGALRGGRRRR